jgi:hypothetical protein
MSFEIKATDMGPVLIHNGNFFALASDDAMIELCYDDPTCFATIFEHLTQEVRNAFDEYLEGFGMGINPPNAKLYSYISALQQFWIFKNIKFAQYLDAVNREEDERG